MKNLILAALMMTTSLAALSQQSNLDEKWANMLVETERTMLFDQTMGLEGEKKAAFDVLYKEYEAELGAIRQNYMDDLKKYAEEYLTLTDE
jgi:hypothetical protein